MKNRIRKPIPKEQRYKACLKLIRNGNLLVETESDHERALKTIQDLMKENNSKWDELLLGYVKLVEKYEEKEETVDQAKVQRRQRRQR